MNKLFATVIVSFCLTFLGAASTPWIWLAANPSAQSPMAAIAVAAIDLLMIVSALFLCLKRLPQLERLLKAAASAKNTADECVEKDNEALKELADNHVGRLGLRRYEDNVIKQQDRSFYVALICAMITVVCVMVMGWAVVTGGPSAPAVATVSGLATMLSTLLTAVLFKPSAEAKESAREVRHQHLDNTDYQMAKETFDDMDPGPLQQQGYFLLGRSKIDAITRRANLAHGTAALPAALTAPSTAPEGIKLSEADVPDAVATKQLKIA